MRVGIAMVIGLLAVPLAAACHENGCDQPPFYECGTYNREQRVFCFYLVDGRMVPALERDVVNITVPAWPTDLPRPPLWLADGPIAYLWLAPLQAFAADPFGVPFPEPVYVETNHVAGLQARAFHCATFVWFAEWPPGCWFEMNRVSMPADKMLSRAVLDRLPM